MHLQFPALPSPPSLLNLQLSQPHHQFQKYLPAQRHQMNLTVQLVLGVLRLPVIGAKKSSIFSIYIVNTHNVCAYNACAVYIYTQRDNSRCIYLIRQYIMTNIHSCISWWSCLTRRTHRSWRTNLAR